MKIGVLAIQGGVIEHIKHLKALGADTVEVKSLKDLEAIDGLILPGGESTAISKVLREKGLMNVLKDKIKNGLPTWGTCAGMILLANNLEDDETKHLQVIDIIVRRNAYGNQLDSFIINEIIPAVSEKPLPLVFVRAPLIVDIGPSVRILHKTKNSIVAAREANVLVTSFHPELTNNLEFHRYFLNMCNI